MLKLLGRKRYYNYYYYKVSGMENEGLASFYLLYNLELLIKGFRAQKLMKAYYLAVQIIHARILYY